MNHSGRLFAFLILSLAVVPGFSQDASTSSQPSKTEPRSDGLRKISSRHNWDVDVHINEMALKANIEVAIENAMKSVDVALGRLEINIEPIEINLGDLNLDVDPVKVNIPDLKINIEPIEIDLDDLNVDPDMDRRYEADEDNDSVDGDKNDDNVFLNDKSSSSDRDKDKQKNKDKNKKEKEKAKGLKKIN